MITLLGLAACRLPGWAQEVSTCPVSERVNLDVKKGTVSLTRISGAVLFETGLAIDADGAPNAYGPRNQGLDFTSNARGRNGWAGLVADQHGRPVLQKRGPYRGYYVSTTSLENASMKSDTNPRKYVDARKIPYIVLPKEAARKFGIRLGDFAVVFSKNNSRYAYAIYADVGPSGKLGEGSIALAKTLGLPSNPRGGSVEDGVAYLVFPGSGRGPGKLRTLKEINRSAARLYKVWGGSKRFSACALLPQSVTTASNP